MINRGKQSWPVDVTLNLVEHKGELIPLGRNLAMRMLLEKTAVKPDKKEGNGS